MQEIDCFAAGMHASLAKPIDVAALCGKIYRWLDLERLEAGTKRLAGFYPEDWQRALLQRHRLDSELIPFSRI